MFISNLVTKTAKMKRFLGKTPLIPKMYPHLKQYPPVKTTPHPLDTLHKYTFYTHLSPQQAPLSYTPSYKLHIA
jgi:hypothetical protein